MQKGPPCSYLFPNKNNVPLPLGYGPCVSSSECLLEISWLLSGSLLLRSVMKTILIFFSGSYSDIEDAALDNLIREVQEQNPNIGIRLAKGFLRGKGHRVQRERI